MFGKGILFGTILILYFVVIATANCSVGFPEFLGDGYCDYGDYNSPECGWDGGDCCEGTCQPDRFYACGSNGFECLDPNVNTPAPSPIPPTRSPTYFGCNVSLPSLIGDGFCDKTGGYNIEECLWDGGDCCENTCKPGLPNPCGSNGYACHLDTSSPLLSPTISPTTLCNAPDLFFVGDGYCDPGPEYNNALCDYDGGDCCPETCVSSPNDCGVNGYSCIDPEHSLAPTAHPTTKPPTGFPSLRPSSSPTAAPSRAPTKTPTVSPSTAAPTGPCVASCPAPKLIGARFNDEGTQIIFKFDQLTDTGASTISNHKSFFPCSLLTQFSGASSSPCYWTAADTLIAQLREGDASVGDTVGVLGGKLKTRCTRADCSSDVYMQLMNISLGGPQNPIIPRLLLRSFSNAINECDNIRLDATLSTGKGPRRWFNVSWEVTGSGVSNATAALLSLRSIGRDLSRPFAVPSSAIKIGTVTIKLTVFNTFKKSSSSSVSVLVSSDVYPAVSIVSPAEIVVLRNETFSVLAVSTIPDCVSNLVSSLDYSWNLFDINRTRLSSIVSTSRRPSRFKLPPLSLEVGLYHLEVISMPDFGQPGSSEVLLRVVSGGAVARIGGGSRTASSLADVELDASSSNHPAFAGDPTLQLFYSWSCRLSDGSECGLGPLPPSATFLIPNGTIVINRPTIFVFTVSVTSNKDALSSSDSVALTLNNVHLPGVRIMTSISKVNAQRAVSIDGVVGPLVPGSGVFTRWSIEPELQSGARDISADLNDSPLRFQPLSLSLAANTLQPGITYTFRLNAGFGESDAAVFGASSISVQVNVPPYNGALLVSPESGISLLTSFVMGTEGWVVEPDSLPVLHTMYAFYGDSASPLYLGIELISSFLFSVLPAGPVSQNYEVTCMAVVTDFYGSVSEEARTSVVVAPLQNSSLVNGVITSLLDGAEATLDFSRMNQILSVGAAALNNANCTGAPECDVLNRLPCGTVTSTCGRCLEGYIGVDGPSNEPCFVSQEGSRRLLSTRYLTACSETDTSCQKKCPADCSGNGNCVAYNIDDDVIPFCPLDDISCRVSCVCDSGLFGRSCDMSEDEFNLALQSRDRLCVSFYDSLRFDDVSDEVVRTRMLLSALVLLDSSQVSLDALTNCTSVVVDTVEDDLNLAGSAEIVPLAISALSAALNSKRVMSASLLNATVSTVNKLLTWTQNNSLYDPEKSINIITDNIRISSVVQTVEGLMGGDIVLTVPTTLFELLLNSPVAQIQIKNNTFSPSDPNVFSLSVIQYTNNPARIVSNSSVVGMQAAYNITDPLSPSTELNFTIVLQNKIPFSYHAAGSTNTTLRCKESSDRQPYSLDVDCAGISYGVTCPGNVTAEATYFCPDFSEFPVCNNYGSNGLSAPNRICSVSRYTNSSITCSCSLEVAGAELGGHITGASLGSGFIVVTNNFLFTWKSIKTLSAASITQNPVIFSIVVSLICLLFVGLIVFGFRDVKEVADRSKNRTVEATSIKQFFDKVVPKQFDDSSWPVRFMKIMSERHSYICFFFPLAEDDYRTSQWLILMGKLINYTFVGTILTVFFFGDDGTCERQNSRNQCLALKSIDFETSVCAWNDTYEFCEYVAPSETFMSTIILALAINVLCVPLDVIVYISCAQYKALLTHYVEKRIESDKIAKQAADAAAIAADPEAIDVAPVSATQELKKCPSKMSTLIRAARLAKMQSQIDNLDVNAEVSILLSIEDSQNRAPEEGTQTAAELLADYVTPPMRDFRSVVARKVAVSGHIVRQGISGKSLFDGRASIIKSSNRKAENFEIGDATSASEHADESNAAASKLQRYSYQQILRRNIKLARARADKIKRRMRLLGQDERKEIYLIRKFLVENMIGIRRMVATRFFFGTFNDEFAYARKNIFFVKLWVFFFPLYLTAICIYIFLYGVTLGSRSTNAWLVSLGVSYLQDIALLEVCSIYMVNVVLVSIVYKDLKLLSNRLKRRAKAILNRVQGQMSLAKCYLQHLNAACRAARAFPQLGTARLLISLRDADMPTSYVPRYHKPKSRWHLILTCLFTVKNFCVLIYLSLPDAFQDALIETFVSCAMNFFFIAIYLGAVVQGDNAQIAAIVVFFVIVGIFLLPWTKSVRSYVWNWMFPRRAVYGDKLIDDKDLDQLDDDEFEVQKMYNCELEEDDFDDHDEEYEEDYDDEEEM